MAEDDPESAFSELSEAIGAPLTRAELLEVGHLGVTLVVLRTKKGLDADGKTFRPYKPGYEKTRGKAGLRGFPPDLARSGHMLGALTPEVTGENEVTGTFASELEAIKAATNNDGSKKTGAPAREFMDIRLPREMDVMGDAISEILARRGR